MKIYFSMKPLLLLSVFLFAATASAQPAPLDEKPQSLGRPAQSDLPRLDLELADVKVRVFVELGEEEGQSRVVRDGVLQPKNTLYKTGDFLMTEHLVKVIEVVKGPRELIGTTVSVWLRGGIAPTRGGRSVMKRALGGGYLVNNQYYELYLDRIPTTSDGTHGYFLRAGEAGAKFLKVTHSAAGLQPQNPGGADEDAPPGYEPEICQANWGGFDSFDEAIAFAKPVGRWEENLLIHGTQQNGPNIASCYYDKFYRVEYPFELDENMLSYANPHWDQPEACAGTLVEAVKQRLSWFHNAFSSCNGLGWDWELPNKIAPRVIVTTCLGADCEPTIADDGCPIAEDFKNCMRVESLNGLLGETTLYFSGLVGYPGVNEIVEVDLAFDAEANFDLSGFGGAECAAHWANPAEFVDVLAHELGHVIGLDHSSNFNAMMFGGYKPQRNMTCDDLGRAAVLYPRESCGPNGTGVGWPCSCGLAGQEVPYQPWNGLNQKAQCDAGFPIP